MLGEDLGPCVNRSDGLVLKIIIRQAPILSAMRIKFVGSVNNKKQACSLLQILNIKKSVPADWQMRKGEKLGQTVIGKPSLIAT